MNPRYFPPVTAIVGFVRTLAGQVHFTREWVGEVLVMENGERHRIFRELRVDPAGKVTPGSMVTLRLRFKFARFSPAANRRLSLIPVPIILGMPGFRQKTWTFCKESGFSQGIYQFESPETMEGYRRSPVMRVLEKRCVPGSMTQEVMEGVLIEEYLKGRVWNLDSRFRGSVQ